MASVESREDQLALGIEIARDRWRGFATGLPAFRSARPLGKIEIAAGGDRGLVRGFFPSFCYEFRSRKYTASAFNAAAASDSQGIAVPAA